MIAIFTSSAGSAAVGPAQSSASPSGSALLAGAEAHALLATDPAKAASIAKKAGELAAQETANPRQRALAIATSQWIQGEAALRLNDSAAAKTLLSAAYDTVVQQQKGSSLEADILVSRARLESVTAEVQSALVDYLSAFKIYKALDNRNRQAVTLQDIGLLYSRAGNYERALNYFTESKATFSGSPTLDLSVANNSANALDELGRFGEAAAAYQQALEIAGKLGSPSLKAQVLNNLASAQINIRQYAAARANLEKGLAIAHGRAAAEVLPGLLLTNADLALKEGRIDVAKNLIEIALRAEDRTLNHGDEELHLTAYKIYKAVGDQAKALSELEIYQKTEQDHQNLMASASSALLAARFDFDNQNTRIALLTQGQLRRDIALTRLRARQSEIIALSLATLIAVLVVFFVVYLRTLQRSRNRLHEANVVLNATNVKLEQALLAKTQFLATTSHEIRTPLNGILGMTEVILADRQATGWVRQRVSLIHEAGVSMRTLVDDLLDMSKMDAAEIVLQRDVVDLPTLLWEVHNFWLSQAESAGLTLSLDIKRAPIMIVEDARRLRQILSNLLSNAVKFTPSGVIAMSAETAEISGGGEQLLIRVTDSGIGIPSESRDLVFEKFTQLDAGVERKYGGTGLGLSIARSLARAMGGDIDVGQALPSGSAFTVTLPLERVLAGKTSEQDATSSSPTLSAMRIVIVEPNPIRQSSLRAALERRVETITFEPVIKDVVDDLRASEVHVVIASVPKGDRTAETADAQDLGVLAAAAQVKGVRLVVIVDEGVSIADAGLAPYSVSLLERPVSAARLLEHLEGLCELDQPLTSLRA